MNVTCFILAWPENDSRYNTGVLFRTPHASLRVTTYVTLWVIICICMADNLENPIVTTRLEQMPWASVLHKDTYAHNGGSDKP